MSFNLRDMTVNGISLITNGEKPAVPKAETKFSIFKTAKQSKLSKENILKLEEISKGYDKIAKKDIEKEQESVKTT